MRYFPIFLDLKGEPVLLAGGGEQAAQKLRLLLKTDARVTVLAPRAAPEIAAHARAARIVLKRRRFRGSDLDGVRLVYAATGEAEADAAISSAARERGIPVNVVDAPAHCSFITPAIVDRDPVTVAIGTEGAAPVLARDIKARLEAELPSNLGQLAVRARGLRDRVAARVTDGKARRRLWERLLLGPFRRRLLAGDEAGAARTLDAEMDAAAGGESPAGEVSLIGCGPGDPDLMTLRAQQRLQEADVLVVDRLVNPQILEYARRDAERIFVGKTPGGPATGQDEINRILVREATAGKRVARLKGGDPFIFGRAVEEMAALEAAGIAHEVVPGVTAALACAASVSLPVTSRGRHRKFSVLTGTTADGALDHDWAALASEGEGFAVYMGVRAARRLQKQLLAAGLAPETPVVLVENGTLPHERAFATSVRDLALCVKARAIKGPAVIFIGLDWAEVGLTMPFKVERFSRDNVVLFGKDEETEPAPQPANPPLWIAG